MACFRAAQELRSSVHEESADVFRELWYRIRVDSRVGQRRPRTGEELDGLVCFWWRLQYWRTTWLESVGREDTEQEVLSEEGVVQVQMLWQQKEMWQLLTPDQRNSYNKSSIYNAILNNKTGWAPLGKAIVRNKMPQLPHSSEKASATEGAEAFAEFVRKMATWLSRLAESLSSSRRTEGYKRQRWLSGVGPERRFHTGEHDPGSVNDAVAEELL